jgi:hypothetical protein
MSAASQKESINRGSTIKPAEGGHRGGRAPAAERGPEGLRLPHPMSIQSFQEMIFPQIKEHQMHARNAKRHESDQEL